MRTSHLLYSRSEHLALMTGQPQCRQPRSHRW